MTSLLGYNKSEDSALQKVQVRVNKDDTVDFSGVVNKEFLLETMLGGSVSEESLLESAPALKYLPNKLTVYFNFSGEVVNNTTDITVNKASLMGVGLPKACIRKGYARKYKQCFEQFLKEQAEQNKGSFDMVKPQGWGTCC